MVVTFKDNSIKTCHGINNSSRIMCHMTKLYIVIQTTLDKFRKIHYKDNPDGSISLSNCDFSISKKKILADFFSY